MKSISKILLFLLVAVLGVAMVSCKKKDNPSDDKKIEEVTFENVPTSIYVNDEFTISYSKQEGVTASFVSNDAEVAKVEGEKVTALKEGMFTLTAKFELDDLSKEYKFEISVLKAVYAITYNLNDGVQGENAPTTYDVRNLPLSLVNPTREGYTFAGWYNNAELTGDAIYELPVGTLGTVELWAKYESAHYQINYELNEAYDYEGLTVVSNAESFYIPASEIAYSYDYKEPLNHYLSVQNPYLWGENLTEGKKEYTLLPAVCYDEELLDELISPILDKQVPKEKIEVSLELTQEGFVLKDNKQGLLDTAKAKEFIGQTAQLEFKRPVYDKDGNLLGTANAGVIVEDTGYDRSFIIKTAAALFALAAGVLSVVLFKFNSRRKVGVSDEG